MFDPNYLATAPFTATGQILLSPAASTDCTTVSFPPSAPSCIAFDLVGQGLLTVSFPRPAKLGLQSTFNFSTPEPSTLWLLGLALMALGFVRKRLEKGKEPTYPLVGQPIRSYF